MMASTGSRSRMSSASWPSSASSIALSSLRFNLLSSAMRTFMGLIHVIASRGEGHFTASGRFRLGDGLHELFGERPALERREKTGFVAGAQKILRVEERRRTAHHQRGDVPAPRVLAQSADQTQARPPGQSEVQEDQAGMRALNEANGLLRR